MSKKVSVQWVESLETETFENRTAAAEAIKLAFAESGINPVEEVWEGEEGDETPLTCGWTVELIDNG